LIYLKYRPETPPNTPQWACAAAHQNKQDNCNLDSPQHHCIPHQADPPHIAPLQYNYLLLPLSPAVPGIIVDDPFGLPPPPVQQYQHLSQHLAEQFYNLPALAPGRGCGCGCGVGNGNGNGNGNGHLVPISIKIPIYYFY
jgi:hypothetical protein